MWSHSWHRYGVTSGVSTYTSFLPNTAGSHVDMNALWKSIKTVSENCVHFCLRLLVPLETWALQNGFDFTNYSFPVNFLCLFLTVPFRQYWPLNLYSFPYSPFQTILASESIPNPRTTILQKFSLRKRCKLCSRGHPFRWLLLPLNNYPPILIPIILISICIL